MFVERIMNLKSTILIIVTLFASGAIAARVIKPPTDELEKREDYEQMEEIRKTIILNYPNSDLNFLGQSLTWVGELMKIWNETEPTDHTIQNVAFSEDFLEPDESHSPSRDYFMVNPEKLPSKEEEAAYENYLESKGLLPKSILARYKKFRRRTVIIDYVSTGKGLSSFIYFIFKLAEKEGIHYTELRNALQFFIIKVDDSRYNVNSFHINNNEFVVNPTQMHLANRDTLLRISTPEQVDGYVRLVGYYPSRLWNQPPRELNETEVQRKEEIVKIFRKFVHRDSSERDNGVTAMPTLVLRAPAVDALPPINLELPSTSSGNYGFCQSRFKRNLRSRHVSFRENPLYLIFNFGTSGLNTLNRNIYEILSREYVKSLRKISFMEFVEDELENPISTASKILRKACNKMYSNNYHATDKDVIKYQSSCNEYDDNGVLMNIMTDLLDPGFFGETETEKNVDQKDQSFYGYIIRNSPNCFLL